MEKDFVPVNQTLLESIRDVAKSLANVIAKTMDADVLIVDNNLNVVGKTGLYFRLYSQVDIHCIIGQVLLGQKRMIMEDRLQCETCGRCPSFDTCQISGLIGVPVFLNGRAVGAIVLIMPRHRVDAVFKEAERTVVFLENMAELMAGSLRYNDRFADVQRAELEKERVLDCLDEGVVYTDHTGEIQYYNRAFSEMFGIRENCKGQNLLALIPHKILRDYLQSRIVIRDLKVSMEHGNCQFYGFLSCREVSVLGDTKCLVFSFRSVDNIWADASAAGNGSLVTLEWCRGWLLEDRVIDRAKMLAVTSQPILIQGVQGNLNEIAAKAVCNYSDRSALGMVNVYCDNIYREFFEQFLFSRFGEIQRANNGTLILHHVDNLPLYLQERLLQFMKTKEIILDNSEVIRCDVRLIFTTTGNLKEMAERGEFLEELYYRVGEAVLELPLIQKDKTRLAAMLDSGMEYYKAKHRKPSVVLSRDAKLRLLNRGWGNDPNEIDKILERIVKKKDGLVTDKDLAAMGFHRSGSVEVSAISEMEKEKIENLLRSGYSKVEIAKMLGIGRATLYRKMAEYQLDFSKK